MRTFTVFCLILIAAVAVQSADVYNFFFVDCAQIVITPYISLNTLKDALGNCTIPGNSCNGVQKISDNNYTMFKYVFGETQTATSYSETYLFDRTDAGPVLTKAPSSLDAKMFYNIYYNENCPYGRWTVNGSYCSSSLSVTNRTIITEALCDSYPAYMKSEFNSISISCAVLSKETIIAAWT